MIEIVPKPAPKVSSWRGTLFLVAVLFAVLSIAGYFILNYSYQKTFQALEDVEKHLDEDKTLGEIDILEKEIFDYQRKINDFSEILESHQYSSKIFNLVESLTHPQVMWSDFSFDEKNLTVSLSGLTQNFQILGQQILILEKEESLKEVSLSDVELGEEGKIIFKVVFNLDTKILK